jgi:hypothetical protein
MSHETSVLVVNHLGLVAPSELLGGSTVRWRPRLRLLRLQLSRSRISHNSAAFAERFLKQRESILASRLVYPLFSARSWAHLKPMFVKPLETSRAY